MGFFSRLFGRASPVANIQFKPGDWNSHVAIAGLFNHQDNARRAMQGREKSGQVKARLVPEKGNQQDPNAVRVEIGGRKVGYLTREAAQEYRSLINGPGNALANLWSNSKKQIEGYLIMDWPPTASPGEHAARVEAWKKARRQSRRKSKSNPAKLIAPDSE